MNMQGPPTIVVLKDGTDQSQGRGQICTNIDACVAVVDTVRTTLGPRGMDKLMVDNNGEALISNDGATIMKELDVVHPAARVLVDIARSQDQEVGDGTTSVVVLAGELLKQAKPYIEDGIHPQVIIKAYRKATQICLGLIERVALRPDTLTREKRDALLLKLAGTAMNSKLIAPHKDTFAQIVVDCINHLDERLDTDLVGIKHVLGGALQESRFVDGVAFEKTFTYAGFGQLPKRIENPRVLLLNIPLEWQKERDNAEIRIEDPAKFREIVDAEFKILYEKLDKIAASGATVVLSSESIGDLATQYFVDHGIFCAGRVDPDDIKRLALASNATVQATVHNLKEDVLGTCALFHEQQLGAARYNFFDGCPNPTACTILLRGGARQFIDEAERSIHDALMIAKRGAQYPQVVAGAAAIEMKLHRALLDIAAEIPGKEQLMIEAFAKALLIIPRQLCDNAGFDATTIVNNLVQKHYIVAKEGKEAADACWYGVDIQKGDIADCMEMEIWEPAMIRVNALKAASEAACQILSVDDSVKMDTRDADAIKSGKRKTQMMKDRLAAAGMAPSAGGQALPVPPGMNAMSGRGGK